MDANPPKDYTQVYDDSCYNCEENCMGLFPILYGEDARWIRNIKYIKRGE